MTQAQAFDILKTGANVFLTGEPGSGKTHLMRQYIAYLRRLGIEAAVTEMLDVIQVRMGQYISSAEMMWGENSGEFDGFDVK